MPDTKLLIKAVIGVVFLVLAAAVLTTLWVIVTENPLITALVVIALGAGVYFYIRHRKKKNRV